MIEFGLVSLLRRPDSLLHRNLEVARAEALHDEEACVLRELLRWPSFGLRTRHRLRRSATTPTTPIRGTLHNHVSLYGRSAATCLGSRLLSVQRLLRVLASACDFVPTETHAGLPVDGLLPTYGQSTWLTEPDHATRATRDHAIQTTRTEALWTGPRTQVPNSARQRGALRQLSTIANRHAWRGVIRAL